MDSTPAEQEVGPENLGVNALMIAVFFGLTTDTQLCFLKMSFYLFWVLLSVINKARTACASMPLKKKKKKQIALRTWGSK